MRNNVCARKMKSQTQNIMKQFDLDEYIKNPSMKVITRRGLKARIICTDRKDLIYPIVALIETKSGGESLQYYTKDGKYYIDALYEDDLFFAPEKYEGWLNVYRHTDTGEVTFGAILHTSREKAEKIGRADGYYAATAKIEWEE